MRGKPRCFAQRPLPSMMTATCRGNRSGTSPAAARRSSVSESKRVVVVMGPSKGKSLIGGSTEPIPGPLLLMAYRPYRNCFIEFFEEDRIRETL